MTLPVWPIATYAPQQGSFKPIQRSLDPISTDFEGGNTRERPRPGDNVGSLTQTIWMTLAEHDTFVAWVLSTLNNGTARFTMNVWMGSSFIVKTCQFIKPGTNLTYAYISTDVVAVTMTLRVYGMNSGASVSSTFYFLGF
ncbi:hypothetical protein SAMN05444159_1260 [Bradyrhizobium lablabi]|uniref:Uncharacterized protein n=1 Tax=Bradyrhizobium lablabi TaxID=722472 RepID=A0A1M6LFA9_9BRAD|nr:hypothetical protein [Bradyrhizobium lablabi]SHJ69879.1 hypothetical protein SAMN05444159_1260 [Bradyrhizobium lablabi]